MKVAPANRFAEVGICLFLSDFSVLAEGCPGFPVLSALIL
jgi:hypothetical protein